jgi:hypothetical protein
VQLIIPVFVIVQFPVGLGLDVWAYTLPMKADEDNATVRSSVVAARAIVLVVIFVVLS